MKLILNTLVIVHCIVYTPLIQAEQVTALDEMVVIASQQEKIIAEVPYSVYNISNKEVTLKLQAKSLPEALAETPGILLQKTGNGMSSPYMRGFTSQRVVLMTDGISLNNSFLREGPNQYWNLVDHYFYDDIEVMMGPASLLYGSGAVGGVVNIRNKPLKRGTQGSELQWLGGHSIVRAASAENSLSAHIQGKVAIGDKLTLKMGLTGQDFGDLRTGDSTDNENTGYSQWSGNLRGTYWFDNDNRIVFGYDHFNQNDVDRTQKTVDYKPWQGTTPGNDDRRIYDHYRRTLFSRYEIRNAKTWFDSMDFSAHYSFMQEDFEKLRWSNKNSADFYETQIDTIGLALNFVKKTDRFGDFTYGFDYAQDKSKSSHYRSYNDGSADRHYDQGLIADNALYSTYGLYLYNELGLTERLDLVTGARYSWTRMNARNTNMDNDHNGVTDDLKGNWDALTLSGRAIYHINPDNSFNIFAGISQGFRAPNLSDTTRDDEFGGGTEAPTADLDAEHFLTLETGFKIDSGKWKVNGTAYYTFIKDRIARLDYNGTSTDPTKRNTDSGFIYGIEGDLSYDFNQNYTAFGRISWQYGSEDSFYDLDASRPGETSPMSRVMPLTSSLGLRYQTADRFWGEAYLNMAGSQDRLAQTDRGNRFPTNGTPGYLTANIRGGYKLNESTDLSIGLENIADTSYRIHGSGINEPGRNLIVSLRKSF